MYYKKILLSLRFVCSNIFVVIWNLEHARDSVRQMEQIRFHLQLSEDPHGSTVALYVGNLTPNLNQVKYENVLLEHLGRENKYNSIGPIYYEYGSLVITYEGAADSKKFMITKLIHS